MMLLPGEASKRIAGSACQTGTSSQREPKSRTTEFARPCPVHLTELVEHQAVRLGGDSDAGVIYRVCHSIAGDLKRHTHAPFTRELECVVDQRLQGLRDDTPIA